MKIQVVDFEEKYLGQALDVLHETNCLHVEEVPEYFVEIGKDEAEPYLRWVLEDKNAFAFIAMAGDEAAGLVIVHEKKLSGVLFRFRRFYEILDIVVAEKYRNAGVGHLLHEKVVERARQNGIKRLELEVFDFNQGLCAFIKSFIIKKSRG